MNFTITFWNGETETGTADNMKAMFETRFGGPVENTGYNTDGLWFASDNGIGSVMNSHGDVCASIREESN